MLCNHFFKKICELYDLCSNLLPSELFLDDKIIGLNHLKSSMHLSSLNRIYILTTYRTFREEKKKSLEREKNSCSGLKLIIYSF